MLHAEALNQCNQRRQPQWSDSRQHQKTGNQDRYWHKQEHTHTRKETHTRRCICTVCIWTHMRTHMRAHKRWKHTLIKSRILEAAVKNDQGMTSITGWLSQHRRQLHLNWTCTSLDLLEVDTVALYWGLIQTERQGGLKKLGGSQKRKRNRWIATDHPENVGGNADWISLVTQWSPLMQFDRWSVLHFQMNYFPAISYTVTIKRSHVTVLPTPPEC